MKPLSLLQTASIVLMAHLMTMSSVKAATPNESPFIALFPYQVDDFEDGVIDTNQWEVVNNGRNDDGFREENGKARMMDAWDLASREDFWPTPEQPVRVSGRWVRELNSRKELSIFLRSTGYQLNSSSSLNGFWDGMRVRIEAWENGLVMAQITPIGLQWDAAGQLGLSVSGGTETEFLLFGNSENLDFEITDDGTNISLTVTAADNPSTSGNLTYASNHHTGTTSRVVFSSSTMSLDYYNPKAESLHDIELEEVEIRQDIMGPTQVIEDTPTNIGGFFVSDPDAIDADIQATVNIATGEFALVQTSPQSTVVRQPNAIVLTGSQDEITNDLASGILYLPRPHFVGSDTMTVTVNDLGHAGTGDPQESVLTLPISVTPVPDPPTATDETYQVSEGEYRIVAPADGILANDFDVDDVNTPLTIEPLSSPQYGTLNLAPDGGFTYRHWGGTEPVDSFTYRVSDGNLDSPAATVTLEITPVNDPPVLEFAAGRALNFDGISDGMRMDNPPALDGSFTIEFRAKNIPGTYQWAFARGLPGHGTNLILGFRPDGTFTMAFYPNDLDTPQAYTDTNWHHWAAVYDLDDSTGLGSRSIYRDGVLVAQDHNVAPIEATGPIYLGTWSHEPSLFGFEGALDEVRIWSIARSQAEINHDLNVPILGTRQGLEAIYHFDETGPTAIDDSGNNRNGVLLHDTPEDSRMSFGDLVSNNLQQVITIGSFDAEGSPVSYLITGLPTSGNLLQYPSSEPATPLTQADLPAVVEDSLGRVIYHGNAVTYSSLDSFTVVASDGATQSGDQKIWFDIEAPGLELSYDGTPIQSNPSSPIDFEIRYSVDPDPVESLTIKNIAALSNLNLVNLQLPDSYNTVGAFPSPIAPQQSATLDIAFNATALGEYSGMVAFETNDPIHPVVQIPVTGTVSSSMELFYEGTPISSNSSVPIDFENRYSSDPYSVRSFTVKNNAAHSKLTLSNLQLPSSYQIVSAFPSEVEPQQTATLQIAFDANAPGDYSGTVEFETNDPVLPFFQIPVIGTVSSSAELLFDGVSMEPNAVTPIDFGVRDVVAPETVKSFTIKNNASQSNLNLSNIQVPVGYRVVGDVPSLVAPQQATTLQIAFDSSASGDYPGTVKFETNDPLAPIFQIPVTGTVLSTAASASTAADSGPGSLRDAIANVATGGTVTIAPSLAGQTIRLNSRIDLTRDVTIDGSASDITLENPEEDSVFRVAENVAVTMNSLTFEAENNTEHGLVANFGRLTILNSTLRDTTQLGFSQLPAPGIVNTSELHVENSSIITTSNDKPGGGIRSTGGNVTLIGVTIRKCHGHEGGGGIYQYGGTLTVDQCHFVDNFGSGLGGGILAESADVTISGSTTVLGNSSWFGGGGIAIVEGDLTASELSVTRNFDNRMAGGIFFKGSDRFCILNRCVVSENQTRATIWDPEDVEANGGGIYCQGFLKITHSTIGNNVAKSNEVPDQPVKGGGIFVDVPAGSDPEQGLILRHCTISGNRVDRILPTNDHGDVDTTTDLSLLGGALYVTSSSTDNRCIIENCTIIGNEATFEPSTASLPQDQMVGGIYLEAFATLNVSGSIIAGNPSPSIYRDVIASANSQFIGNQYNLIGEPGPTTGFDFTDTDLSFASLGITGLADVLETTLQDNGGATLTHRLVSGSPAIDAGAPQTPMVETEWDQRGAGYRRVNNGHGLGSARIDIGAVEYPHTEPAVAVTPAAEVVGRHIFYNESAWDGNNAGADATDDNAIATDKIPLRPGQKASFLNYTSYSRGINGIMIDIANLPGSPSAADFTFHVGNNNDSDSWPTASAPNSITVRPAAGVNGSDRITLLWSNNAIQNQWLQVTVLATTATGLDTPDVFFFGNAIGECGNSTTNAFVDVSDENASRQNPRNFLSLGPIHDPYDYNRDRKVDITDQNLVRNNHTNFLTALKLIDLATAGAGGMQQMSVSRSLVTHPTSLTEGSQRDPRTGARVGNQAPIRQIFALSDGWIVITADAIESADYILQTTNNIVDPLWETVAVTATRNANQGTIQWVIDTRTDQAKGFFQLLRFDSMAPNALLSSDR